MTYTQDNNKEKKPVKADDAYRKLSAMCATAEYCESDLRKKLERWGVGPEDTEKIFQRLRKENFINEHRFAKSFCNDKVRFTRWGRRRISMELNMRGISPEAISEAFDAIDDTEYISILENLLQQKAKSVTGRNEYEKRMKLMRFAAGRGFETDIISDCIDKMNLFN